MMSLDCVSGDEIVAAEAWRGIYYFHDVLAAEAQLSVSMLHDAFAELSGIFETFKTP